MLFTENGRVSAKNRKVNVTVRDYRFEVALIDGTTRTFEQRGESVTAALGCLQGRLRAAGLSYISILEVE